jgi:hypothetical protein
VPSGATDGIALESPLSPADHDIAVIATAHSGIDCAKLVRDAQLVVDLRNATGRAGITSDKIWKLSSVSPTRTSAAGLGTSSISSASWPTSSGSATRTKGASATLHPATPEQERRRRSTMPWRTPRDAAVVATPVPTHCALAKRALEARKRVSLRHRRNLGVVHVGDLAGWEAEEGRGGAVVTKDVPSRGRRRERGAGDPPGARRRAARCVGLPRSRCRRFGLRKSTLPIRVSGSSARNSISRGHDH